MDNDPKLTETTIVGGILLCHFLQTVVRIPRRWVAILATGLVLARHRMLLLSHHILLCDPSYNRFLLCHILEQTIHRTLPLVVHRRLRVRDRVAMLETLELLEPSEHTRAL